MVQHRETALVAGILRAVLHDLAQPAASATLAAEIAALELARGRIQAAEARLATAVELLGAMQRLMQAYGGATPGGGALAVLSGQVMDPARVVADVIPGATILPCPPVAFSADLLRLVLRRLAQALGPADLRCHVAPASKQGGVRIRIAGRAVSPTAVAPWTSLLRLADAAVRHRSGEIIISLPDSASADCANGNSLTKR